MNTDTPSHPTLATSHQILRWLREKLHPLLVVPGFVLLTQWSGECYPLSPFPMYSNPEPHEDYVYLTDGTDTVVAVQPLCGLTASQLSKTYRKKIKELCATAKVDKKSPPPAIITAAVADTLAKVQERAAIRRKTLPARLRFVEVIIRLDQGQLTETTQLLGEIGAH
jgi:hypothetical protein